MKPSGGIADFEAARFVQGENFAVLLPLRRGRQPALTEVLDKLAGLLHGSGAGVALDPLHRELMHGEKIVWLDHGTAFLLVNEVQVMVSWRPDHEAKGSWEREYVNPKLWPDAGRDLARCKASVVITEMGVPGETGLEAAFDRAVAITLVAEAIWMLTQPVGLLWSPAHNALPPSLAKTAFETVRGGHAALQLWMRTIDIPQEAGTLSGLRTRGLKPLIGCELAAPPSLVHPQEMLQHIFHLASRLIDNQTKIRQDEVFGRTAEGEIRLRASRGKDGGPPVISLIAPQPAL